MFWNLVIREYERLHLHQFLLLCCLLIYSLLGAIIFCALEAPSEEVDIQRRHLNAFRARKNMLNAFHAIYNEGKNATYPPEGRLLGVLNEYNEQMGLTPSREQRWDIWGGLYYSGTIYTTIGYGDLVATTLAGRIFTVLYALIGIPMVITILNDWGTMLFRGIQTLWSRGVMRFVRWANRKRRKGRKRIENLEDNDFSSEEVLHCDASSEDTEDEKESPLPLYAVLFVFTFWMLLCTTIFSFIEGWSMGEAAYFFFISLTTIGFGDFTPRYHVAVANFLLILIGLSVVSMTINVIQMQLEALFAQIVASIDSDFKNRMTDSAEVMRKLSLEGNVGIQVDGEKLLVDHDEHDKAQQQQDETFIKGMEKSMHGSNRLLMRFMSNHQKKMLTEKFEERAKMRNSATQTSVQIRVASVQTKDRDEQPIYEEEEEEEVITTTTMQDGRIVLTTRLVPKRKMYIYNTGD